MALCHVTGIVYLPDGTVAARREVAFYKLPDNVTADYLGAVVPEPVVTRTDNDGAIDVNLITGNYHGYTLDRNGSNRYQFKAVVPEAATADFSDLISATDPIEPMPAWLQQAIEARDDARAEADRAEGEADRAEAAATEAALYEGPWLDNVAALLADPTLTYGPGAAHVQAGDIVRTRAEGFSYLVAASDALDYHVTTAGGVKLYVLPGANGAFPSMAFGHPVTASVIQTAIDKTLGFGAGANSGEVLIELPSGRISVSETIYLRRSGVKLRGAGFGATEIVFSNPAGGTVFAGDTDKSLSLNTYSRCELSGFSLSSSGSGGTDYSIGVDLTSFSYSYFNLFMQTRRTNAAHYFGQGNAGSSPYYNQIHMGYVFGDGSNRTMDGLVFKGGLWTGGANGGNANNIYCGGRATSLRHVIDIQAGQGNVIHDLSGESIAETYIRIGHQDTPRDSGISTGSNAQNTIIDTSKAFPINAFVNGAIVITGGTGVGQIRSIRSNTATSVTINETWAIVPDATSTYEIFTPNCRGNKVLGGRAEGSSSAVYANLRPGCSAFEIYGVEITTLSEYVLDESGYTTNSVYPGGKLVFTEVFLNPGPSVTIDAKPRAGVQGGVRVAGKYAVEWVKASIAASSAAGSATVTLDAGGTTVGAGSPSISMRVGSTNLIGTAIATGSQKSPVQENTSLFLTLQTDSAYTSANRHIIVTYCVSLL